MGDHWSMWRRAGRAGRVAACVTLGAGLLGAPAGLSGARAAATGPGAGHGTGAAGVGVRARNARLSRAYAALPLRFEANKGQTDSRVRFLARGAGYTLFLTPAEAVLTLAAPRARAASSTAATRATQGQTRTTVLRLRLDGANPRARVAGLDKLPGVSNYLVGRDRRAWRTGVRAYARVAYQGVLPGVDQVYYGFGGRLEYDFVVAPGADPGRIHLSMQGAGRPRLDARGGLVFQAADGVLRQAPPVVYQTVGRARRMVAGHYALDGRGGVTFRLGAYDHGKPLVIDPVLAYATYLGGGAADDGSGIAVDGAGDAYVAGTTGSTNFPTQGAYQANNAGVDNVFVSKLNPTGTALLYSTYLGGTGGDAGYALAIDGAGDAYLTGSTNSTDFPTTSATAVQGAKSNGNGANDAFVAELDPSGARLLYGAYLGGSGEDTGNAIAVDRAGAIYVTGFTYSSDFPTTTGAYSTTYGGGEDAFVTKIVTGSKTPAYSTYLGGGDFDEGTGIAVDPAGDAYVTGVTGSSDFPTTTGAYSTTNGSGAGTAFVTELNPSGHGLVYSTYLGGSRYTQGNSIALDSAGDAYVAGYTEASDFPTTTGAYSTTDTSVTTDAADAFIARVNAGGGSLGYSTLLGGAGDDQATGIALDPAGDAYVTGYTASTNFPTTSGASSASYGGGAADAFLAVLNPVGSRLTEATYLGGSGDDYGYAVAVDCAGSAYLTGQTSSSNLATSGAPQGANNGNDDAFVAKIGQPSAPTGCATGSGGPTATPEPGSGGLYATGLVAIAATLLYYRRRRARR